MEVSGVVPREAVGEPRSSCKVYSNLPEVMSRKHEFVDDGVARSDSVC